MRNRKCFKKNSANQIAVTVIFTQIIKHAFSSIAFNDNENEKNCVTERVKIITEVNIL